MMCACVDLAVGRHLFLRMGDDFLVSHFVPKMSSLGTCFRGNARGQARIDDVLEEEAKERPVLSCSSLEEPMVLPFLEFCYSEPT